MKRNQVEGNVLVFRNPEDKTSCIGLNVLVKTENQRSGEAREERVTVVKT